ncbi:MAG: hypothetical protein ACR2OM_13110 [Aestuariivirgaceae bacterium]
MNWLLEAQQAVIGSWRLLLRDTGGYDDFDLSERGFWRSFSAIVPIAPLYLYAATIEIPDELTEEPSEQPETSLGLIVFVLLVQWITWPLVMVFVARVAGFAHNYSRYIIAYNWSSILVLSAQMVPALMLAQGGSVAALGNLVFVLFLFAVLYYHWYIALTALETTMSVAWTLVLADLVIGIGITRLFS